MVFIWFFLAVQKNIELTPAVIKEAVKIKDSFQPKTRKGSISVPEVVATPIGAGKCYLQEWNYAWLLTNKFKWGLEAR